MRYICIYIFYCIIIAQTEKKSINSDEKKTAMRRIAVQDRLASIGMMEAQLIASLLSIR